MLQIYKTITRAALSVLLLLFFAALAADAHTRLKKAQNINGKRGVQFFGHFAYRFQVPETEISALRQYLSQNFAGQPPQKEVLTDIYFDTENHLLLYNQAFLRSSTEVSAVGHKARIHLFLPEKNTETGREIVFRHNRKPDKGTAFTTHPLLKLLRAKDRPVLDSLLQRFGLEASALKPVLESTRRSEIFSLQRQSSNWLFICLTQFRTENPENEFWQLAIYPDRKLLTHGATDLKKALLLETRLRATALQQQFPGLKPLPETEYAFLQTRRQDPDVQKNFSRKAWLGVFLLLVLLALAIFWFRKRNLRKRRT